jgi:tetratricopeptide (TPR) repeat protein
MSAMESVSAVAPICVLLLGLAARGPLSQPPKRGATEIAFPRTEKGRSFLEDGDGEPPTARSTNGGLSGGSPLTLASSLSGADMFDRGRGGAGRAGGAFRAAVLVLAALVAGAAPLVAAAQPGRPAPTAGINVQAEVAAAVYAATATHQAIERGLDGELKAKRQQIEALQARVKAGEKAAKAQLALAQKTFTDALAARDRLYAAEIAAFRGAVEDIAKTPEGVEALAVFNGGDEAGALAILDRLAAAREEGRQKKAAVEHAADLRRNAALALEARDRGKVSTAAVIARYEEVTALDPGLHWDWVTLCRLYREAGKLADARKAAEQAARTATRDRERSVAFNELGDVETAQGDLAGARKAYEQGLVIARALAAADPSNAQAKRDLSISLGKLGDVVTAQGDLASARKAYEEALAITRALAASDPSNPDARRDVSVALNWLGQVLLAQGDYPGARKAYEESLAIARDLAAFEPPRANARRDLSAALWNLGAVLAAQGDLAGARKSFEEGLAIARAMVAADPSNADARRVVFLSVAKLGEVLVAQGDFAGARTAFEEGLGVARALAAADPSSADARRNVSVSLNELGDVLVIQGDLVGARKAYEESLGLRRALAASDPSSGDARRDVGVTLDKLGKVLKGLGDLAGARKAYEESLGGARAHLASDPSSADAKRDVAASLWRLAEIPGSGVTWAQVVEALEAMEKSGQLAPADRRFLDEARRNAAAERVK